ncbi:MAG: hypothetical protein QOF76_5051 [Solirubrobacteraceae bacterium]|nr:hypothetical protein [Solirubrobacteraceae bacterium]
MPNPAVPISPAPAGATLRSQPDLLASLDAIAASVADGGGYRTAVVNVYRPAFDDFEVVVVHGSSAARETLLGVTTTSESWRPLVAQRYARRGAYFVAAGSYDWDEDPTVTYTPPIVATEDPDAWHPDDALFVVLRSSGGRAVGMLSVDEPVSGRRPSDQDLDGLVGIAAQAGLAIESAQQADAARRHRADLQHLLRISGRLTRERSRTGIAEAICEGIRDALDFERVAVVLRDADGLFRPTATVGWAEQPPAAWTQADMGAMIWPGEDVVLLSREDAHARTPPHMHTVYSSQKNGRGPYAWNHHWLVVPLRAEDGSLFGTIWPDDPGDRLIPTDARLDTLRAFANQAASALEAQAAREQLRHLSEHDPLTGLRNRRALSEAIDAIIEQTGGVAVVTIDADGFKRVNDELGYSTGDDVLCSVADEIRAAIPPGGIGVRLGGEEFALVLPHANATSARLAAEALRAAVVAHAPVPWGLTLSAGVAVVGGELPDADAVLRASARALSAAKRLGRDRVVAYDNRELPALLEALDRDERQFDHQLSAMLVLAEALDLRDAGTAQHSKTVARYAEAIAARLDLDPQKLKVAGLLHDIGKVAIADAILHKPSKLDDAEWAEIKRHPEMGERMLNHAGLGDVARWVLAHHERMDGGGYPYGLAGDAIPLEARVLSVADSYEAMTAPRPYRPAPLSEAAARAELQRCAGTQFDPVVVEAFLNAV